MANPQREFLEDGYIKLSRKIFISKTFSNLNAIQKLITIYLILMANHKDNEWWDSHQKKFITIKRGSFITSVESIRKKINDKLVTPKKIRAILSTLSKMDFLAIKTTNKYTLITIVKYDLYQDGSNYEGKQKGKLRASKGQSKGKQRATNKNVKNDKNVKKKEKGMIFQKAWKDFKTMRTKIRKPLTERAEELIINELNKLATDEKIQVAILNQSIMNSWQGVFPLKDRPQDSEVQPKYIPKKVPAMTAEQIEKNRRKAEELMKKFSGKFNMPGNNPQVIGESGEKGG